MTNGNNQTKPKIKKRQFATPSTRFQEEKYQFMNRVFEQTANLPVDEVIENYGVPLPKNSSIHRLGLCPFHNDRHIGSFVVTPSKGIFCCFVCGADAGYAGNGVQFVSKLKGISYKDAALDVAMQFGLVSRSDCEKYSKMQYHDAFVNAAKFQHSDRKVQEATPEKAPDDVIHSVYSVMKEACELKELHMKHLVNDRKLSMERIRSDYFSFPDTEEQKKEVLDAIHTFLPDLSDDVLSRVPGFFYNKKKRKIDFSMHSGIAWLIRSADHSIKGIQIRRDQIKEGTSRYVWFSSSFAMQYQDKYQGGASCGSPKDVCYPVNDKKDCCLCITEGRFKSELLAEQGSISISVQGVTSWKGIDQEMRFILKDHYAKNVWLFFDSDIFGNHKLFQQTEAMVKDLKEKLPDLEFGYALWKKEWGKGIDDCMIAGHLSGVCFYPADVVSSTVNAVYERLLTVVYGVKNERDIPNEDIDRFKEDLQISCERRFIK